MYYIYALLYILCGVAWVVYRFKVATDENLQHLRDIKKQAQDKVGVTATTIVTYISFATSVLLWPFYVLRRFAIVLGLWPEKKV